MENRPDPDIDDDFSELYKEYTGPLGSTASKAHQDKAKENKRSHLGSNEEEEQRDPNSVPTDFTSREAKVWEAKSKATERNWKKRKEEEMICKICGVSGHFTQGCPTTLGANHKSQDFFERVPARDPHVRALFSEKVIQRIEKDIGCKIKMDDKFIIVSGKDRLILKKGVDAVHKVKDDGDQRGGSSSSRMSRSRSPQRSPIGARLRRPEPQRAHSGPRNSPHVQQRFVGRQDRVVEDRVREDLRKISRDSPQAYGNDGARSRLSHSKSPGHLPYAGNSFNSYDGHNQNMGAYRADGWEPERRGSDLQSGNQFEYHSFPKALDELELEFKREVMELWRIHDKEEDEENYKHRETINEMRENHIKKSAILKDTHTKQWDQFLQLDAQRCQQQMSASGFGAYKQQAYSEYNGSSVHGHYAGANLPPMDSRGRYPNPIENDSSRGHDSYGEFQRLRREDFGKAYYRY